MSMFGMGSVPELMSMRYDEFYFLANRLAKILEDREKEAKRGKGIFSSRFPV